jgi:hypothetical protein
MPVGSHILPALVRFGQTLLMLAAMLILSSFVDPKMMLEPTFADSSNAYKVYFMIASLHVISSTLFVGFMFAECHIMASGMGYTVSQDGKTTNYNSIRTSEVI